MRIFVTSRLYFIVFTSLVVFISDQANAFPEMARHGYVNCTTCHISPNGGGVLNEYGRELSKELLATWKNEDEKSKENQSLYGVLAETPLQKWLTVGGDVRSLYLYRNDSFVKQGRTLLMQASVEPAVLIKKWSLVGSLDYQEEEVISRKHFLMYAVTSEFQIRAGKFIPAYGINTADHVSLTRSGIRMGPRFDSYNVEFSYINENLNGFITAIIGRSKAFGTPSETGLAWQGSYSLSESKRLGLNVLRGTDTQRERWLFGPFGMLGLTKQLMVMSEVDFQSIKSKLNASGDKFGIMTTQKASYEFMDGLWGFVLQEYGKTSFKNSLSGTQVYGLGLQFFPRTHFELNLTWEKARSDSLSNDFYDYAWFSTHFYL